MESNERVQRIKLLIVILSEEKVISMNSEDIDLLISDKGWAILTSGLTERESEILNYRVYTSATREEVGKRLNITRERVKQIESKAKRKIYLKYRKGEVFKDLKQEDESVKNRLAAEIKKNSILLEKVKEKNKILSKELNEKYVPVEEVEFYSIDKLNLSVRTRNCLIRAGYKTFGDLLKTSKDQLMKIRYLGKKSFNEIVKKIEYFGYEIPLERQDDGIKIDINGKIING